MSLKEKDQLKGFISPMQDIVFKTLWTKGGTETKDYLNRIIEYVVGFSVKDFYITSNELPIENEQSIANRVDILLESKDKLHKVNIELNPINQKTTFNKNISYLFKIAGEFYSGMKKNKYNNDIHVEQVNLNGFYHDVKDIATVDYKLYDVKNDLENKSIKIHDIFLPRMKELCYDNNEIYLDYAMFMCSSFEEMEKYICGNKERKCVMETLKNFVLNKNLPTYDYGEYLECLKEEIKQEAHKIGLEEGLQEGREAGLQEGREAGLQEGREAGLQEGRKEGLQELIAKMLKSGLSQEEVDRIINTTI